MKFDCVLLHNKTKKFSRYNSINGLPAISSKKVQVFQGKTKKEVTAEGLYEVAIGDFIIERECKDGTAYIIVYKVIEIREDVIIGDPC